MSKRGHGFRFEIWSALATSGAIGWIEEVQKGWIGIPCGPEESSHPLVDASDGRNHVP